MKKTFLFIFILILSFFILKNYKKEIIIPNDALRFRVIANSNSEYDQLIKSKVRTNIEKTIIKKMNNVKTLNQAEITIKNSLNDLNFIVNETLKDNNYNTKFDINFGYNHFPKKEYKGVIYKEGKYKSLVITLGEGKGNNWWCVLFPPLCLVDAEETNKNDIEYRFFIKELIDKYFN